DGHVPDAGDAPERALDLGDARGTVHAPDRYRYAPRLFVLHLNTRDAALGPHGALAPLPCKSREHVEQLVDLLLPLAARARAQRVGDARLDVTAQEEPSYLLERALRGRDLQEHVDAVRVGPDHPLEPLHLSLDPPQPPEGPPLGLGVDHARGRPSGWPIRSPCLITSRSTSRARGLARSARYFSQYRGESARTFICSTASVSAARSPFRAARRSSARTFAEFTRGEAVRATGRPSERPRRTLRGSAPVRRPG